MANRIIGFSAKYRFLSNFWFVPGGVYGYPTVEHFYQAMKFDKESPNGPTHRQAIKNTSQPGGAKSYAHRHRVDVRDNWEEISIEVMTTGLKVKFAPGTELAKKLLGTVDAYLEEGNHWHDTFYGKCYCPQHRGKGENNLGLLLMHLRAVLSERDI